MEQTKKKGIFYGWVNVAIGAVLMAAVMGIVYNCFGQFIKPVCEELGISRRAMSVSQVLMSASQIAVSLLWGWILKHTDLKKMMILWAVAGSAGYYCYSLGNSVWVFYFASIVAGAAMSMLCILPFTHIIDNWFVEKKGLAMGICFMGSGVGGMVFNSLLGVWLETLGWRGSFRLLAIIMAALSIPGTLLLKVRPEDMGLKAYGHEKAASTAAAARVEETGMTLAEAKRSPKLWLTLACVAMITMAVASGTQILSPHMTDNGYSVATAANMMSLSMGALAIGKMVTGGLYDLLGTKKATMLCLVFGALCVVGILLCQYPWALVLVILGTGFGCPVTNVGYPLIIQAIFGKKDFAAIVGIISAASSIGISIVPLFNGASYDMFGDYRPAFMLWLAFIVLAALIMLFLLPEEAVALLQSEITSTPCVLATYLWEDAARAEAGGPGRGWDIVEYVLDAKTGKLSVKCGTYPDQFGGSRTLERELTPAEFHAKAVALEMREQLRMMQTSGDWEKVLAGESVRAMLEQHEREEAERKAAERAANCVRLPEEFRAVRPKMDIDSVELRLDQRYSSTVLQLSKLHGRYCFGKASVLQKLLDAGTIGTENLNMLNDAEAAWVEHEVRRALKSLNRKTWQSLPGGDRMSVEIVIGGRRKADLQNEKPMDKYTDLLFALRKLERYGSDARA